MKRQTGGLRATDSLLVDPDRTDEPVCDAPPARPAVPGSAEEHRGQLRAGEQGEHEAVAVEALRDATAGLEQARVAQAGAAPGRAVSSGGAGPTGGGTA